MPHLLEIVIQLFDGSQLKPLLADRITAAADQLCSWTCSTKPVYFLSSAWGPCGSSDLCYVTPDGGALSASAAYGMVNGERDSRPFLALMDEIRHGAAQFVPLPDFPAVQVTDSEYQGIDARGPW